MNLYKCKKCGNRKMEMTRSGYQFFIVSFFGLGLILFVLEIYLISILYFMLSSFHFGSYRERFKKPLERGINWKVK